MSYLTAAERREHEREERRRLSRQQIFEHVKKSLLYTPFDSKWIPHSANLLLVGQHPNNNGSISIYELHRGELRVVYEQRVPMPIKCATFGHSDTTSGNGGSSSSSSTLAARQLATGDFSGSLQLWDLEVGGGGNDSVSGTSRSGTGTANLSFEKKPVLEYKQAHTSLINAIDGSLYTGPPEIVTGSRDGAVRVWDPRQATRPIVSLNPVDATRARDCWSVRFGGSSSRDTRCVAAGYDNGDVKIFDLRVNKMLQEFNVSNGVCSLDFDRPDIELNKLAVACLEGVIRFYDLRTLHPRLGYAYVEDRVSDGTVWSAQSLPQNREISIFGGAGELTLTKYEYPSDRSVKDGEGIPKGIPGSVRELNKVKVGEQPINSLDWNKSKEGLLACTSFDQSVRVMLVTKLSLES